MSDIMDRRFKEIFERILQAERILLTFHKSPDGDCTGSAFALYYALRSLGKDAVIVSPEGLPFNCQFLNRGNVVRDSISDNERFDLTIVLDLSEPKRLMRGIDVAKREIFGFVINLDHHITGSGVGDVVIQIPEAAATAEIVYDILKANNVRFDRDIAEALYTAIMTDTGGFRYSSTTAKTFSIASDLMNYGISSWEIAREVYESEPKARIVLLSYALSTLRFEIDDSVAYMSLTLDMIKRAQATDDMTDQFVNYARSIRGVKVGMLFRETQDGKVKVSLRSKDEVDIARFSTLFGGGGHRNAAGIVLSYGLEESIQRIITALKDYLK